MYPSLIYVAGAYAGNVSANIIKAERVSIALIRNGWHVFTPHKNTAGYEKYEDIPKSTWLEADLNILERCDAIYVMDNWRTSSGTEGEIAAAQKLCRPIFWEDVMLPDCAQMNVRCAWWGK
jgi:nucleoside 2-deoxyribosyltransferase